MEIGWARGLTVVMLGVALAGCSEGEKEVTLPHGDTLTVPESHEFKRRVAYDSLSGFMQDGEGRPVFSYDACPIGDVYADPATGQPGRSVNAEFFYGHFPDGPGLWVVFPSRGPSALTFDEQVGDEAALEIVRSLRAVPIDANTPPSLGCRFSDP